MIDLKHFKKSNNPAFADQPCLVCGTGPSMNHLNHDLRGSITKIGVNNIGNYVDVDYLVIADDLDETKYPDEHDKIKIRQILESNYKYLFSYFAVDVNPNNLVRYEFDQALSFDIGYSLNHNRLSHCHTSAFIAISLAIYMGFKQIGLIGIDIINHTLEKSLDKINHGCDKMRNYAEIMGVEILNLSAVSQIRAFNKAKQSDFWEWYVKE